MNNKRLAYMTVDDAPTEFMIQKMEYLIKKEIPAIFYCKGRELAQFKEFGVELVKNGFVLGNHAYSHPHFSKLTIEQAKEEITRTHETIKEIYAKAGKKCIKTFRFPYGDKGAGKDILRTYNKDEQAHVDGIQNILKNLEYKQPLFKGVTHDWYTKANLQTDYIDAPWTYQISEWEAFVSNIPESEILSWMDKDDPENMFGLNSTDSSEIVLLHDHPETNDFYNVVVDKILTKNFTWVLPEFEG